MEFTAFGHQNISAKHKATLEFTKDGYVTPTGDCILGIKADFGKVDTSGKIRIQIRVDGLTDELTAVQNPGFDSHEMVIRKSDFIDRRTFATKASKAAIDIDRAVVEKLKSGAKLDIIIEPKI